jgi:hypothetical protein
MQTLPRNLLEQIARLVTMENRRALEKTSRPMRQVAQSVSATMTVRTRKALCGQMKLPFMFFSFLQNYSAHACKNDLSSVFTPRHHLHESIRYAASVMGQQFARLPRPFNLPKLDINVSDSSVHGITIHIGNLFVGVVNQVPISVLAEVRRDRIGYFVNVGNPYIPLFTHGVAVTTKKVTLVNEDDNTWARAVPHHATLMIATRAIHRCAVSIRARQWKRNGTLQRGKNILFRL